MEYNIHPEEELEEIYDKPKSRFGLATRIVGFLVIAGLIYITGVQQALFYKRTPLGIPQGNVESVLDAENVTLPLRVFVFRNDENFGSERSLADIRQMVRNADEIWNQADIDFDTERIIILDATDAEIGLFFDNPSRYIQGLDDYDPGVINIFLTRSLKGIPGVNGIAFTSIRATAVADFTTVYDFRVLAHEIGHILSLTHVEESKSNLMYKGANGIELSEAEVLAARVEALEF